MKLVVIESPYAPPAHVTNGDERASYLQRNAFYLRALAQWCVGMRWAPYASHKLLTQWLDDEVPEQRDLGIAAGLAWARHAELAIVGVNYGISSGMNRGIDVHVRNGVRVKYVFLNGDWRAWSRSWPASNVTMKVLSTFDRERAIKWVQAA